MQRERNFYMFAKNQPKAKIETVRKYPSDKTL